MHFQVETNDIQLLIIQNTEQMYLRLLEIISIGYMKVSCTQDNLEKNATKNNLEHIKLNRPTLYPFEMIISFPSGCPKYMYVHSLRLNIATEFFARRPYLIINNQWDILAGMLQVCHHVQHFCYMRFNVNRLVLFSTDDYCSWALEHSIHLKGLSKKMLFLYAKPLRPMCLLFPQFCFVNRVSSEHGFLLMDKKCLGSIIEVKPGDGSYRFFCLDDVDQFEPSYVDLEKDWKVRQEKSRAEIENSIF